MIRNGLPKTYQTYNSWESTRCRLPLFSEAQSRFSGIMGYVKNLHNGSVFTTAQGNILALNNFIKWCYIGPQEALVSNIEKTYEEIKNFNEFRIVY